MSRVHAGICPALEDLLLAEKGELPPPAQAAVEAHLVRCVACRSALFAGAGLLRMVGHVTNQFGETRDTGNTDAMEARFHRFRVALHARMQQRIHKPAGLPVRRWLAIAVVPLLIAGFIFIEPHTAVIEADELVQCATSAEAARPAGTTQRVRIRLTESSHFAMSGVGVPDFLDAREQIDGIVTTSAAVKLEGRAASIAQMLADHRFNWRRLLNASDFSAWRSALPRKHDDVIALRGTPPLIVLRTTTMDDGDLREVELTVERETYRVVRESFVFETMGKLEIDQSAQWVRRALPAAAPAATTVANATRPLRPAPERASPLGTTLPAGPQPDLSRWLDRRFGNSAMRSAFMPDLRRLTGAVRQRLDSLQDLSSRYPGSEGPQASPAARARLQRELDLQYHSLRRDLDALYLRIIALTLLPNEAAPRRPLSAAARQPRAPEDWSRRVDTALPQAFKLDRLAGELRGYDDLPTPVRERVADTFDKLWAAIYAVTP